MKKPETRMERTNLTLPTHHKNILRKESMRLGISMSDVVRRLIDAKTKSIKTLISSGAVEGRERDRTILDC